MVSHALAAPRRKAFRINTQATFHVRGIKADVHQGLQGPGTTVSFESCLIYLLVRYSYTKF
jgi:hypothetical protein